MGTCPSTGSQVGSAIPKYRHVGCSLLWQCCPETQCQWHTPTVCTCVRLSLNSWHILDLRQALFDHGAAGETQNCVNECKAMLRFASCLVMQHGTAAVLGQSHVIGTFNNLRCISVLSRRSRGHSASGDDTKKASLPGLTSAAPSSHKTHNMQNYDKCDKHDV
jgi:hypothetical protein